MRLWGLALNRHVLVEVTRVANDAIFDYGEVLVVHRGSWQVVAVISIIDNSWTAPQLLALEVIDAL